MPKMQYYFKPDQFTEPPESSFADTTAVVSGKQGHLQALGAGNSFTSVSYQWGQVIKMYISEAETAHLSPRTH